MINKAEMEAGLAAVRAGIAELNIMRLPAYARAEDVRRMMDSYQAAIGMLLGIVEVLMEDIDDAGEEVRVLHS